MGRKDFFEQPGGVELLEPLRVAHVRLFSGHAFDVAGVDQEDLRGGGVRDKWRQVRGRAEAGGFEQVAGADPLVAGAFERDGGDAAGQQRCRAGLRGRW